MQRASNEMKDDEDVVRAAVAKDPRAIKFASQRLRDSVKFPPTEFWPPREPTDFERRWGEEVLHILLNGRHGTWEKIITAPDSIWTVLEKRHPESARYFGSWPGGLG